MRVEFSGWDLYPYSKRPESLLSLPTLPPPSLPCWGYSKKAAIWKPGREFSPERNHADILISDFPASRIVRNDFLLFKSPSLWFYYGSLNWDTTILHHHTKQFLSTVCYHPFWKGFQVFTFLPIGQQQKETISPGRRRAKKWMMRLSNSYVFSSTPCSSRLFALPWYSPCGYHTSSLGRRSKGAGDNYPS